MAGIAFDLRKIVKEDSIQGKMVAWLYTGLITSGPWLFAVVALSLITTWGNSYASRAEVEQFMAITIYCFAFSMMLTGGTQMVVTRMVSDLLYKEEDQQVTGIFLGSVILTLGASLLLGGIAAWWMNLDLLTGLMSCLLLMLSGTLWMCTIFISALQAYLKIFFTYVLGFLISIPLALVGGNQLGLPGFLLGLNAGIAMIVMILASSIVVEFPSLMRPNNLCLIAHQKYWLLYISGFSAHVGVWMDKLILWLLLGSPVIGQFYVYPVYDGAMFLSYLTVLPSMAFFVMVIETDFYQALRRYLLLVENKAGFPTVEQARIELMNELKVNGRRILLFQILFTTAMLLFSPFLMIVLHLDWLQWGIFRIGCLAAFFHMANMQLGIVLAYFDCRKQMLATNLIYLIAISLGTWYFHDRFWLLGTGYLLAGLFTSTVSLIMVVDRLKKLNFYTFFQPEVVV